MGTDQWLSPRSARGSLIRRRPVCEQIVEGADVAYDPTALVVAVVGVAGTLSAPVLSQRASARARNAERDEARLVRQAEWAREDQRRDFLERRECYVALLVALRRIRIELKTYVQAVADDCVDDDIRSRLEEARRNYRTRYSESAMILPRDVELRAKEVDARLARISRKVDAIKTQVGNQIAPGGIEDCLAALAKMTTDTKQLRLTMRADLGLESSPDSGDRF